MSEGGFLFDLLHVRVGDGHLAHSDCEEGLVLGDRVFGEIEFDRGRAQGPVKSLVDAVMPASSNSSRVAASTRASSPSVAPPTVNQNGVSGRAGLKP